MSIPCECYNGRWEPYDDNKIGWDNMGRPEHITEFTICMNCNCSWSTRWLIGNLEELTIDTTQEVEE